MLGAREPGELLRARQPVEQHPLDGAAAGLLHVHEQHARAGAHDHRATLLPPPVGSRPCQHRPRPSRAEARWRDRWTSPAIGREAGTDKATRHRFTQHYERHLGHLRDEEFTLFEIGIGGSDRPRPRWSHRCGCGSASSRTGAGRRPRHRRQVVRRGTAGSACSPATRPTPRCCPDRRGARSGPRRRRRRQPPARARPRDVPDAVPAAGRRRLLRHRGHPDERTGRRCGRKRATGTTR